MKTERWGEAERKLQAVHDAGIRVYPANHSFTTTGYEVEVDGTRAVRDLEAKLGQEREARKQAVDVLATLLNLEPGLSKYRVEVEDEGGTYFRVTAEDSERASVDHWDIEGMRQALEFQRSLDLHTKYVGGERVVEP